MMRQLSGIGKLSRQFLSGAVHGFVRVCVAHTCSKTGTCPVCKYHLPRLMYPSVAIGFAFRYLRDLDWDPIG